MRTQQLPCALLVGLILLLASVAVVLAAGNIDPADRWAWGTNVGWISFELEHGGVTVYSDHLEGYAWGENTGWIRFKNDSSSYKVMTSWHGDLISTYQNDIAAIITTRRPGPASSGGLTIEDIDFLNDPGDGIIFGHQNGADITTADCPTGVVDRWQRLWEFDVNDGAGISGGTVTLTFDFSDAGFGASPSGAYTLLKRSGTSGVFAGIATTSGPHTGDQVVFSHVSVADLGSYFTLGSGTPTAVKLVSFEVAPHDEALLVSWETASELDNVGFNLYRSTAVDGPYALLNDTLIPPQFPGEVLGGVYEWLDTDVEPDVIYYYRLEDIDVKGVSTFHGPVSASLITGPTAVHLQRIAARSALTVLLPLLGGIVVALGLSVVRRRRR